MDQILPDVAVEHLLMFMDWFGDMLKLLHFSILLPMLPSLVTLSLRPGKRLSGRDDTGGYIFRKRNRGENSGSKSGSGEKPLVEREDTIVLGLRKGRGHQFMDF